MTLKMALIETKEVTNDSEAFSCFVALYGVLGKSELHDGIYVEMCDNGYSDFIETLLDLYGE